MATAQAQRPSLGRIEGVVRDSIHASALSGALVLLARRSSDTTISRNATTDAQGRFSFNDVPTGDYIVALESPFLDSLDLAPPASSVAVAPGEGSHVTLVIPSGATLRTLTCPSVILPPGVGAVSGWVRSAVDERPLHGAVLSIRWSETTVDRPTLRATSSQQAVEVKTDSLGRFLVCGVPTDTYLEFRASLSAYKDVLLQLVVPEDAGVGRQDVSLSPAKRPEAIVARSDSVSSSTPAASLGEPNALSGAVYGSRTPLVSVQVQLRGDSTVVSTDSLGHYHLAAVSLGTQVVEVRRVGYLPRQLTVELRAGQNTAPDLYLTPIVTLDSIRVVGQRTRYREFESRARATAFGHFLRAEDIAHKKPLLTSDLVRQLPGFRIIRTNTSNLDVQVIASRGDVTSLNEPSKLCYANIIIDGVPHQMINWIDPQSIGAMEIYPGPAGAPVQYQSACGTILIWTKRD